MPPVGPPVDPPGRRAHHHHELTESARPLFTNPRCVRSCPAHRVPSFPAPSGPSPVISARAGPDRPTIICFKTMMNILVDEHQYGEKGRRKIKKKDREGTPRKPNAEEPCRNIPVAFNI